MVGAMNQDNVCVRLWDAQVRFSTVVPFIDLHVKHVADMSVDTVSFTVADDAIISSVLAVRDGSPRFVTVTANGVELSATVTKVKVSHGDGGRTAEVFAEGDTKHAHRLLALSPQALSEDADAVTFDAPVTEIAERLLGAGALRTGLPIYVETEVEGDRVRVEARPEQTIADVVGDVMAGSNVFVEALLIHPGSTLPGSGKVRSYRGRMENEFYVRRHGQGWWPELVNEPRLVPGRVEASSVAVPIVIGWVTPRWLLMV